MLSQAEIYDRCTKFLEECIQEIFNQLEPYLFEAMTEALKCQIEYTMDNAIMNYVDYHIDELRMIALPKDVKAAFWRIKKDRWEKMCDKHGEMFDQMLDRGEKTIFYERDGSIIINSEYVVDNIIKNYSQYV